MNAPAPRRLYLSFEFVPQAVSVIAVAVGALVLIGWVFDVGTLKSVLPGLVIMKANTATAFVLSGVALWGIATGSQNRTLQIATQVCSGMVLLLGLLTLGEYLSGVDLGIDQLLFREVTSLPGDIPGRMAVNTALSFGALGAALLLLSLRKGGMVVAIHALAIVPIIAAGSALIGYGYNIDELLREKLNYTPMSLHAAIVFVMLAFGVMNARADYPFRRFLTSTNPAGLIVRRLLPAAVGFTLVTGWLILRGYHTGYFSATLALALFTAASIGGLGTMILWNARTVYRAEVQRERMEESLRAASQYARSLIEASPDPLVTISADGKITDVNKATEKATGVARNALIDSDFSNYFTEPDKARAGYQEVFAKGVVTDYPLALRHSSGSAMEVVYNASVYRNEKGEVAGVFAAARDVTELKRTENALTERVKELQAFYHLSALAARKDFPLESLCQELVNILPQSTQYPEIACARIVVRESEFRTANFAVSAWMLAAPISALGGVVGKVELGYSEQKPDEHEGPFLKEERQLIDAIAERIGQITELKRAETGLRASEELFRALANATSEGMLIHEHGRIVEANRQMEDILGRPRAEIVGAAVLDFVAPPSRDMASRHVQTPDDTRVEFAFLRPDGSEVIVYGLSHSCAYSGRPMRISVYRDITLEKRAEEALRNVGTYNRSLIEVSLDPLVTISPDGKITDVNEATVQATGMPRSLLLGSDFSNYFTEPDKARAGYQEVFSKGFVADYPLCLRHVSGRTIDVLYNASVYHNARGEVAGVFAAARDITERKRAEDELRHYHEHLEELVLERTSKLNAVNKDLEEFIYSMAHDLGIPLRAVNGFAHILLTEYRDKLDDEGKRYLDVVQDNTRRMGRLIDDILAFSRLRSAEITVSEISMEELVHEGLDELRPTFAGRELNVEIKPLRSTRGDRTMLRQVWVNLLSNAIKFTREKSPAQIEVGCVEKETELVYYVKDNGVGFDMQYANKLFGVFQRLHGVEEFEGQGIGLAMVKRIVTRHGGRVWAEGKLNEGATIYFALPAKEQEHG